MADNRLNQQLQPRRLSYNPPSQSQTGGFGKYNFTSPTLSQVHEKGSGMSPKIDMSPYGKPSCACERKTKNILCQACGFVFPGRIRKVCPQHPNTIHLMDIDCCPECRANHLKEFSDCMMKRE